jgi:L-asparaginase II
LSDAGLAPVARDERNGRPENWHQGAAAVATPERRLVAAVGDAGLECFLRSSAKPFQCLPLLLAGGAERFELSEADLALICSSHGGTTAHVERAAALLERGGFSPDDLLCGAHVPMDPGAAAELAAAGREPEPLDNNCSGKHAGMLLACRLLELPCEGYTAPDHPLQERIRTEVAGVCGVAGGSLSEAVDGCGVPTFRMPLAAAARAYAALADPRAADLDPERTAALARVAKAMAVAPEMVAGPGRFTTALTEVTGGRVLGKEGAKGYYGVAVRGPVALGLAIKIADGDDRCRDGVAIDILRQLGALSGLELEALAEFHRPIRRNHAGTVVGEVVADVELEEV